MLLNKFGLLVSAAMILAMSVLSIWVWMQLPPETQVPLDCGIFHCASRSELLWLPILALVGTAILMTAGRSIDIEGNVRLQQLIYANDDEKRFNWRVENRWLAQEFFTAIWVSALLLIASFHTPSALDWLGFSINKASELITLLGLSSIVIGRYLFKMDAHYELGIRTPGMACGIRTAQTLSSQITWTKTHRLAGGILIILGAALVFSALTNNVIPMTPLILAGVLALFTVPFYSHRVWKTDPDKRPLIKD